MILSVLDKKWIGIGLLLLSGCINMSKEEQSHDLIAPPSLQSSIEKSLESSFFVTGDWPKQAWWEIFESPSLNALIEESIGNNPTLQSVSQRIEQARQEAKVARSRLFPYLFFDATESWTYLSKNGLYRALNPTVPLNANLVDLTLSFTYEFDFWGKNLNRFRSALGEQRAMQAQTAQAELLTTTAVAQAFFALKANLLREQLYKELYTVRTEIWQLQEQMQTEALQSKFPYLRTAENVGEAEKLLFSVQEQIATTKHQLNVLAGRGPDEPLDIDPHLNEYCTALTLPDNLSLDLLSRRPDLMAQIWHVESLAHEVGAAKADFFPNVNLTALMGLESIFYRTLFEKQSKTGSLQPAIHLPIFTAGAIRANVRSKKAAFEEALFAYNNLILASSQEVADLLALVHSVFSQKKTQNVILSDALDRLELTELTLDKGLSTAFDLYAVQEEVILKELENVNLLYGQYLASIKLIKALGGGYQSGYDVPLSAPQGGSS
ncbi:MAG: efflux transporter outer membrane subunit [Rhabdochlamydiaceae bacterium]|nr:efflux transporter outer membrane subunit [Rhabdochlamydiaceae bacterium]